MKFANMHLHSVCSDGIFTPGELCEIIKNMGYGAIVLSDHETALGYSDMKRYAEAAGLDTMIGMELYAAGHGSKYHILAYDFDPTERAMAECIEKMRQSAELVTRARFDACLRDGLLMGIGWSDVLSAAPQGAWLCNEQIFAALVKNGIYGQKDYWDFVKAFRSARTDVKPTFPKMSTAEVIGLIKNAGGVAVLAHPHDKTQYLPALYKEGLGGVECSHPDIDSHDESEARRFAESHNMYVTGGTDHTGLAGNNMERGDCPDHAAGIDTSYIIDLDDASVRHGASREEYYNLKNRIFG